MKVVELHDARPVRRTAVGGSTRSRPPRRSLAPIPRGFVPARRRDASRYRTTSSSPIRSARVAGDPRAILAFSSSAAAGPPSTLATRRPESRPRRAPPAPRNSAPPSSTSSVASASPSRRSPRRRRLRAADAEILDETRESLASAERRLAHVTAEITPFGRSDPRPPRRPRNGGTGSRARTPWRRASSHERLTDPSSNRTPECARFANADDPVRAAREIRGVTRRRKSPRPGPGRARTRARRGSRAFATRPRSLARDPPTLAIAPRTTTVLPRNASGRRRVCLSWRRLLPRRETRASLVRNSGRCTPPRRRTSPRRCFRGWWIRTDHLPTRTPSLDVDVAKRELWPDATTRCSARRTNVGGRGARRPRRDRRGLQRGRKIVDRHSPRHAGEGEGSYPMTSRGRLARTAWRRTSARGGVGRRGRGRTRRSGRTPTRRPHRALARRRPRHDPGIELARGGEARRARAHADARDATRGGRGGGVARRTSCWRGRWRASARAARVDAASARTRGRARTSRSRVAQAQRDPPPSNMTRVGRAVAIGAPHDAE